MEEHLDLTQSYCSYTDPKICSICLFFCEYFVLLVLLISAIVDFILPVGVLRWCFYLFSVCPEFATGLSFGLGHVCVADNDCHGITCKVAVSLSAVSNHFTVGMRLNISSRELHFTIGSNSITVVPTSKIHQFLHFPQIYIYITSVLC